MILSKIINKSYSKFTVKITKNKENYLTGKTFLKITNSKKEIYIFVKIIS